jgi:hypothetical protein
MARKPKDDEKPDAPEITPPAADDPDKDILRGGPGDAPADVPEPEPDQPSRARVKIGKKEFEVDPDMAAAIEERERDYMRGIQVDRRERDELERYRRAAQPTQPQPTEPDLSTLIFEDPKKALELHGQRIEQRMEQRYRSEQQTQRMWTKFYSDHPDLSDENMFVSAKFSQIYDEIADLPTAKAMDMLADEVRKDILRISRKAKGTGTKDTPPTGRAIVEGATGDRPPQPARASSEDEPASLSAVIRDRARKRREASSA